jgi:hypothetical protein
VGSDYTFSCIPSNKATSQTSCSSVHYRTVQRYRTIFIPTPLSHPFELTFSPLMSPQIVLMVHVPFFATSLPISRKISFFFRSTSFRLLLSLSLPCSTNFASTLPLMVASQLPVGLRFTGLRKAALQMNGGLPPRAQQSCGMRRL